MGAADKPSGPALPKDFKYGPRFASPVNAAPWEFRDDTQFLQVTKGCSHNACRFCTYFKNVPYSRVPLDEVEFYLKYIALCDNVMPVRRVFLQASNAFHLSYDELMEIAELIRGYLPRLVSIGSYARISDLRDKSAEQLRALHDMGYDRLFFGVESADDKLLARVNKGYGADELYAAGSKLKESGMQWACTVMFGLGGHGYGPEHAIKTAEFLNFAEPDIVGGVSLTLMYDKYTHMVPPLKKDVEQGLFVEAGEIERYEEMRTFIQHLKVRTMFLSRHTSMPMGFRALLPDQKPQVLEAIDSIIKAGDETGMRRYRDSIVTL